MEDFRWRQWTICYNTDLSLQTAAAAAAATTSPYQDQVIIHRDVNVKIDGERNWWQSISKKIIDSDTSTSPTFKSISLVELTVMSESVIFIPGERIMTFIPDDDSREGR